MTITYVTVQYRAFIFAFYVNGLTHHQNPVFYLALHFWAFYPTGSCCYLLCKTERIAPAAHYCDNEEGREETVMLWKEGYLHRHVLGVPLGGELHPKAGICKTSMAARAPHAGEGCFSAAEEARRRRRIPVGSLYVYLQAVPRARRSRKPLL